MKITDVAYSQLKNKNKEFIYIYLEKGGCAELKYKFSFSPPQNNIIKFQFNDILVIIDDFNSEKLSYIEIDYKSTIMKKCFYIAYNPYEDESCKCGISFKGKK